MRLAAALLALCFSTAPLASSTTTDFSDLWWDPDESGWGVNLIQQRDILFATLFVYNQAGQPEWYVASNVSLVSTADGILTFSGPLYRTTGPWFGATSFDPDQVGIAQVGSFAFAAAQISNAAISYTVNGQQVTKAVQRQTWAGEDLAGTYVGAITGTGSGCNAPRNGYLESHRVFTVAHNGTSVQIAEEGAGLLCTYSGTHTPAGRMGSISGTASCNDGSAPTFSASEVQVSIHALTMRMATLAGNCLFVGRIAAARRAP